MKPLVRIALVEDQSGYRQRLADLIRSHPGWLLVGEFSRLDGSLQDLVNQRPDLVLLDIGLPGLSGIDALPALRTQLPGARLVMLTVTNDTVVIVNALECGACAYLLKGGTAAELVSALEDVLADGAAMSPSVARRIVAWFQKRGLQPARDEFGLTPREWEVLHLAARGRQQGEIALALGIAVNTVKNHCRNIYEKLGVCSMREALVRLNRGRGLLDLP